MENNESAETSDEAAQTELKSAVEATDAVSRMLPPPDTANLSFKISTRTVEYGDKRKFINYRILMLRSGEVIGVEDGPDRTFTTRTGAVTAARRRIHELRSRRLFVIDVTKKHISDGVGRNCYTCAISQALWHNQERMGLSKYNYSFRVSPYAAFIDADGLVLTHQWNDEEVSITPEAMPDMVTQGRSGRWHQESMVEWAMSFDDWDDAQYMSIKEWREARGYDDGERPFKPLPCSFVLDLDAFSAQPAASSDADAHLSNQTQRAGS